MHTHTHTYTYARVYERVRVNWLTHFESLCVWARFVCAGISRLAACVHNYPKCAAERTNGRSHGYLRLRCRCRCCRRCRCSGKRVASDSFCRRRASFLVNAPAPTRISILLAFRVRGCLPLVLKRSYKKNNKTKQNSVNSHQWTKAERVKFVKFLSVRTLQ